MKFYFSFDDETHDCWPIYEAIRTYYPIGLQSYYPSLFWAYPGQKGLGSLLAEHIHDPNRFQEFTDFSESIGSTLNADVIGTTNSQSPSLSFELILEQKELYPVRFTKKLCFAKSILGNFYTIYGTDETVVKKPDERGPYHFGRRMR